VKATWRGHVVAESATTREAHGHRYFPRDAVRMDMLKLSPKTADDLECPHGVQFYDVVNDAARSERAAWSYEAPQDSMRRVDHWVSFWEDVEIR
jgi:uncharacterized protein (DUF427 family)